MLFSCCVLGSRLKKKLGQDLVVAFHALGLGLYGFLTWARGTSGQFQELSPFLAIEASSVRDHH